VTVHVLMPVFNRLALTRRVVECLRQQVVDERLRIVIVDDGSTDGSAEWLAEQSDLDVLQGDGSLWWGGAIQLALEHTVKHGATTDSVVFVNNDTTFGRDFVQSLLDVARAHAPAAVGSVVRDEEQPARLLSIGAGLDIWRLKVRDLLTEPRALDLDAAGVQEVDALSGRGVLFPLEAFRRAGLMRPRWLPHYLADYELSIRVKNAGYRLLVSEKAAVLSANEFGNAHRAKSIREELFSVRSASYLPANLLFWWEASSRLGKLTLLPRLVLRLIWKQLRRKTA
jgi:N-acetylglucosaminyl-diphospho-decaprenol L-rhamnosyltransferase